MANAPYSFRSALGGFHKGDVTGYIEKIAVQHRSELLECEKMITQLREENHSLQQQLNLLLMSMPTTPPSAPEPSSAAVSEPISQPSPAEKPALVKQELQAYRRAEAVERNATNRARKLYHQMEDACTDTLTEFHAVDSAVKQAIEQIQQQAAALEQSYQTLSATLNTAREALAAITKPLYDDE